MLRLPLALSLVLAPSLVVGCGPKPEAPASDAPAASGTPAPAPTPEPAASPEPTAATTDCQRDPFSTWPACASQTVKIRGTNPQAIMQHPIFASPGPDGQAEHQGYLDVPNVGQIIVLTRAPFECPAAMIATGTLRRIEPTSADPSVKSMDSYGGWVLEGATVECGGAP